MTNIPCLSPRSWCEERKKERKKERTPLNTGNLTQRIESGELNTEKKKKGPAFVGKMKTSVSDGQSPAHLPVSDH